jgi:hypothetical protein
VPTNFSAAQLRVNVSIIALCTCFWKADPASTALLLKSKLSLYAAMPASAVHPIIRLRLLLVATRLAFLSFSLLIAAEEKSRSERVYLHTACAYMCSLNLHAAAIEAQKRCRLSL